MRTYAEKYYEEHPEEKEKLQKYLTFMYNPDNELNCSECPENQGFDSWQNRKPCGQQNCWVTCHCRRN